ncbi:MAG: branched-chain amino acid ABC transporter permease [Alphaproteobacteria bacterium]
MAVPRSYLVIVAVVVAGFAAMPPASNYWQLLITQIGMFGLLAIAFDICLGFAGMLSLATALFYGLGAYGFAYALKALGLDVICGAVVAVAFAMVAALLTGSLAVRLKGPSFLIMSLLLVTAVHAIAQNWKGITGGDDGLVLDPQLFRALGHAFVPIDRYYFGLALFAIGFFSTAALVASPLGRLMRSVKENDFRAEMLGYSARAIKLAAFTWAAGLAGLAGAGYAAAFQHVHTGLLHWTVSAEALMFGFFGGIGTLVGPVVGAAIVLPFEDFMSSKVGYPRLFTGILLVVMVLVHRDGVLGLVKAVVARVTRRGGKTPPDEVEP